MPLENATEEPQTRSALKDPQRRGRLIIGAISLLAGAGYLWQAILMPQGNAGQPGPGLWPTAVGVAWVVISILVIIEAAVSVQVGGEVELPTGTDRRNVILFFVFTVLFVVLIPIAGMYLASIAYVVALLKLTSDLKWWKIAIYGVAIGFLIPFFFITVLQMRLPEGFLANVF